MWSGNTERWKDFSSQCVDRCFFCEPPALLELASLLVHCASYSKHIFSVMILMTAVSSSFCIRIDYGGQFNLLMEGGYY